MTRRRGQTAADDHQEAHARLEERISDRVDVSLRDLAARNEASNEAVREILLELQKDVRRGQMDRDDMKNRLRELELAVGENRDAGKLLGDKLADLERAHLMDTKETTVEAVVQAAPVAAALAARQAPAEVWSSLGNWQKRAAIVAASVAVLAGLSGAMTGAERLGRAIWHGAATAWDHAKGAD